MESKSLAEGAQISGFSMVLLVTDLKRASDFYRKIGFECEEIGGPDITHVHVTRGKLTFILHPVKNAEEVRPASSLAGGLYFDAFCYTDGVDLLVDEFRSKGVEIVHGPHFSEHWSEFTIKDPDGYCIAFGGDVSRNSLHLF